jgi:hypothetical protein
MHIVLFRGNGKHGTQSNMIWLDARTSVTVLEKKIIEEHYAYLQNWIVIAVLPGENEPC